MNDGALSPATMQTTPEKGAAENDRALLSAIEAARKYRRDLLGLSGRAALYG